MSLNSETTDRSRRRPAGPRAVARRTLVSLGIVAALAMAVSACGSTPATPAASGPSPVASAAASAAAVRPIVVTFRVGTTEEFRVLLDRPADIMVAHELLAGQSAPSIPNGRLVRGANTINKGHAWSLDPNDFAWNDVTTEACDGLPSAVDKPSWTLDRYCPWSARVVAIALAQAPAP